MRFSLVVCAVIGSIIGANVMAELFLKQPMQRKIDSLEQQVEELKSCTGKPILVGALVDGSYERIDVIDMNADKYAFIRMLGRGNETVIGVESQFGKLPDRFVWKDGQFISIGDK